jgi:hypothetical protein
MLRDQLKPNSILRGPHFPEPVQVIVQPVAAGRVKPGRFQGQPSFSNGEERPA